MIYDFIEIGTSDFDTLIQTCPDTAIGLSVEPIQYYLDKLPNKPFVRKICAAISSRNGEVEVYSVHPSNIVNLGLPDWVRGCNSINSIHPTVAKLFLSHGISFNYFQKTKVKQLDIPTLIAENHVTGCRYLKLDTEGHDTIILNHYLDVCASNRELLPLKVEFESNILTNPTEIAALKARLLGLGYSIVAEGHDTIMTLN